MTAEAAGERAVIGASITIRGDVTGDEDLVIQGRIEGKVDLAQHHVTVGANGRVKANVIGHSVTVEGEVEGDLRAEEQIAIRKTAKVRGNLSAPRVTLEDGASFQGSIDMERKVAPVPRGSQPAAGAGAPSANPIGGGTPASATPPRPGEQKRPERIG
ncbi:MAG: polymer-forming cytoskeletal protein [Acidobacteriia bacterium]|nr:polymer-forming cytoskeletal protein [Terriglobia bacterium]